MKKSIKIVVAVGIILLTVYSWYTVFSDGNEKQAKYNSYIEAARKNSELGVISAAEKYYNSAIAMKDSIELRMEMAESFKKNEDYKAFIETCEKAIELEPFNTIPYETLMDYYFETGDYAGCYSIHYECEVRGIVSQNIQDVFSQMKYEYNFADSKYSNITDYRSGYAITLYDNGYYGYINSAANKGIKDVYSKATPFSNGYAAVIDRNGLAMVINSNGVKTYVDSKKREITDVKAYVTDAFAIQVDGKYQYVDLQFNDIGGSYDDAGAFLNERSVVKENDKWYVIDTSLNKLGEDYDEIKTDFAGVAFRKDRGFGRDGEYYYLINTQGEKVDNTKYEDADVFLNGFAAVKQNGKWGFIDSNGNLVISPQFDNAKSFANGYAAVCIDKEWHYIDSEGNKVISGGFEDANGMTTDGTAFVCVNNEWRLLQLYSYGH